MHKRTVGVNREKPQLISVRDGCQYKRVKIRTHNKKPIWTLFKEFINSLDNGEGFKRKDLMLAIYEREAALAMIGRETTVDHYRLYSCHIGFVEHVGTGKYIKKHSIPDEMTSTLLKKYAYNESAWQDWFIPKRDKLRRACEACKS